MLRGVLTLLALALWPPCAGAFCLFFINGIGESGAFTELPSAMAVRSLRLAAQEGFAFGLRALPFISLAPAVLVFAVRRYWPRSRSDILAGMLGGVIVFGALLVWIAFYPLDPLLGGIIPVVAVILLASGAITGFLIAWLRPRTNPPTSPS